MWILKLVGSLGITKYVALALGAILTLYLMTQYIQKSTRDSLTQQLQIEQLQQSKDISKRIRDEVNKIDNTANDPTSAYEWLYNRARDSN